jgi:TonB family protein
MNRIATSLSLTLALGAASLGAASASSITLLPSLGSHHQIVAVGGSCRLPDKDASLDRPAFADLPTIAAEQGAIGTTKIEIRLDSGGALKSAKVTATSGNPWIDRAALETASQSRYSPEMQDNESVQSSAELPHAWRAAPPSDSEQRGDLF